MNKLLTGYQNQSLNKLQIAAKPQTDKLQTNKLQMSKFIDKTEVNKDNDLVVFTDGSSINNGSKYAKAGYCIDPDINHSYSWVCRCIHRMEFSHLFYNPLIRPSCYYWI